MAEGNVYIEGIDPSIPQWSTEATLQQIKNILSKENALTSNVSKQIDNLAKGDANTLNVLRQTMGEQGKNNKATKELKDAVVDYRNSLKSDLSSDELKLVDAYIDKIILEVTPAFDFIDKIKDDKKLLSELKTNVDQYLGEDKWLEKLLKIS